MADKKDKKSKNINDVAVEDIYKKKSLHEHILSSSDTYIGSAEADTKDMWIFDDESGKIIKKDITYVPGLYKIYDEILVNARDQCIRDKTCKTIKVNIDKDNGQISVWNDGNGIRVEIHKELGIYVPEMIFGHLLTSSNYETKGKIVGGKNGYGAKAANIYSTEFEIETCDMKNKKLYKQKFSNNMFNIHPPEIKDVKSSFEPYTKISFKPDYTRFGIKGLTNDIASLFKKRVYDMAATTDKSVKVYLNDKQIKVATFRDYIDMFYDKLPSKLVYDDLQERWKVGVIYDSNAGYNHVSFVNGICTYQGGSHLNYVLEQITKKLITYIQDKKKVTVKPAYIRDNITIFVDSIIEDPSFTSQTKEFLSSKSSDFGTKYEIKDSFIKELADTGIVDEVVKFAQFKEMNGLNKTDGKKVTSLRGIDKLDDAQWAGTRKAKYCKLILTEGDSAKAFALSGLEIVGKEKYGVFPLRGKLLNVREASASQLLNNKEFINIKKILGLKQNKKYNDVSKLRYGGIIILTDSDVDGSHIKGLIINMIHTYWPSLLKIKGFITSMATPIIKAFKKSDTKKAHPKTFYTLTEYRNWIKEEDAIKWHIKYYKGLGTSTEKEAKEAFNDFEDRLIKYIWESNEDNNLIKEESDNESDIEESEETKSTKSDKDDKDDDEEDDNGEDELNDMNSKSYDAITLAFEKKRADDRKNWLFSYDCENILEASNTEVGFSEFVNKDLIHFSSYDNHRSIPSICDGFKPSQRKIMYACFKRKIDNEEIKVAQLGAYVAEHTEYHHGEVSLQEAIINMAQDFVGANNINLLQPIGNFGYRRLGGKDSASPRYIFTKFSPLTQYIFRKEDEAILNYIVEEGTSIEPDHYAPVLPMVLINGCEGIGTGFSTKIPQFNPKDVANNIIRMLDEKDPSFIKPWYNGFKGSIVKLSPEKFQTNGIYEILGQNSVRITEIPIGMSIDKYKETMEAHLIDKEGKPTDTQFVARIIDNGGNNKVDFEIVFAGNKLQSFIKSNLLEKKLKMTSSISLTNMYLHNPKGLITKYEFIEDIFYDFYNFRLSVYQTRKDFMVRFLENQMNLLKYKVKFIEQKLSGEIVIEKRKEQDILDELFKKGYPKLAIDIDAPEEKKGYGYITNMQLFSLTKEKIDKLNEEYKAKKNEYDEYKIITIQDLWKKELGEFIQKYDDYMANIKSEEEEDKKKAKKEKSKSKSKSKEKSIDLTEVTKEKNIKTKTVKSSGKKKD